MKHLVKKIFDIKNNRKITVTVDPSENLDDTWLTKKFFPTNKNEVYFYESVPIVQPPDD